MNVPTTRRPRLLPPLLGLFSASILSLSLHAQTAGAAWTSTGGGAWGDAGNWRGGRIADGAGVAASFASDITAPTTVTLDASRTVGSLSFSDNGAGGHTWTIAGRDSAILTLATGGPGSPLITTTSNATISSPVQGAQGFVKAGGGTLSLINGKAGTSTLNVISGPIEIAAGALFFGGTDSIVNVTSPITIDSGATLGVYGNFQFRKTMTCPLVLDEGGVFAISGNAIYKGVITLAGDATIIHGANTGAIYGRIIGDHTLTLTVNYDTQPDLAVNAAIQTGAGGLVVNALNTQRIVLGGDNTFTGDTTVNAGQLIVTGRLAGAVVVKNGALFGGSGSGARSITVNPGGALLGGFIAYDNQGAPVLRAAPFVAAGAVTLSAGSSFVVHFNGKTAGFGGVIASGFSLGGATLTLKELAAATLKPGEVFTLMKGIDSPIAGTFANLPEGALITSGKNTFRISYAARQGRDVTLTTTVPDTIPEPSAYAEAPN